jgi:HAD superfamily hydrolase (TIGR01450 family)
MVIKDDVLSIVKDYDSFFVDVYGVLYDGVNLFENTLLTMKQLVDMNKKVIVLSNTTQVASDAKVGYTQRGMLDGVHYNEIVTSGELLHRTITDNPRKFTEIMGTDSNNVKCLFMGNFSVFADSHISTTDSYDNADFIYVGIPRTACGSVRIDNLYDENGNLVNIEDVVYSDWIKLRDAQGRKGPEEFARSLEVCLRKNKTLLVANPDIFAHGTVDNNSKKVPIFTQGIIGRYYERFGGKVVYFGKPYRGIFEYAMQFVDPNDRVAMVGDTPWTDILGANMFGIDSAVVMTGVSKEFLERMDVSMTTQQKLDTLINKIGKRMVGEEDVSLTPTYVLKRFANCDQAR